MDIAVFPRKIITGEGSVNGLSGLLKQFRPSKAVLFADPILIELGMTGRIEEILAEHNVPYLVFKDIKPEPPLELGDKAVQTVRDFEADLVIGIGGGSCLDCAKVAAALARNEGTVGDYLNLTGTKKLTNSGVTKILLPTTAGTGAEVTTNAVFSLGHTKDIISDEHLLADVAIIDPEFTYSMPPRVTAASGVDALTHAIESYTSKGATELTDALALEAVRKINRSLRTAVWNGSDRQARGEMAWGSLIASLSYFNAGVHAVHALAYPLGGLFKIPHGESNAVLLPYLFDHIWPACMPKMKALAEALELPLAGKSDRDAALAVVQYLLHLVKDVGLPTTIREYGIGQSDLDRLSNDATEQKRLLGRCPKSLKLQDIRQIYQAAYDGTLAQ